MGGGETARFRVVWGKLDGWGTFRGCSGGSSVVYRHFTAVARGPERGMEGSWAVVIKHVVGDVAVFRGGRGGLTRGCGAADRHGGMLVGPCGFGVAADGRYSTISGDDSATIVSDVARIAGPLADLGGGSSTAGGRWVAPEGICSFIWAADGGFSTGCGDDGATVVSDVACVVWLLGGSSGG